MKNRAFTLVELIIVIVILGILSAFAIPKFINLNQDAARATDAGIFASFKTALHLAHTQWIAKGKPATITLQNETISMTSGGWPGSTSMTVSSCENLFHQIMDTSVETTQSLGEDGANKFFVTGSGNTCYFVDLKKTKNASYRMMQYRTTDGYLWQHLQ